MHLENIYPNGGSPSRAVFTAMMHFFFQQNPTHVEQMNSGVVKKLTVLGNSVMDIKHYVFYS
jgi:hypothetical protein